MGASAFLSNFFIPLFVLVGLGVFAYHVSRKSDMKDKNFSWYKAQHPDLVSGPNVKCYQCGGSKIAIRNVGDHYYMRAHACVTCGTNLYYSSER